MKRFASFALILAGCGSGFATASHGGGDGGENDAGTGGHVSAVRGATDAMPLTSDSRAGTGGASKGGGGGHLSFPDAAPPGSAATDATPPDPPSGGAPGTGGASSGGARATGGAGTGASGGASGGAASGGSAGDGGPTCLTDLSGVGTGDFRISFTLTTTARTAMALVNQNAACQQACGGAASTEWDVLLYTGGLIEIETDNGIATDRVFVLNGHPVNDGQPHRIIASRISGRLSVAVDGQVSTSVPDMNSIGILPSFVVGHDPCANSAGNPGCPAVYPLSGALTDLCVSR